MEITKDEALIVLQGLNNVMLNFPVKVEDVVNKSIKTDQAQLPPNFQALYDKLKDFTNDSNTPVSESDTSGVPDTKTPTTDITDAEIV